MLRRTYSRHPPIIFSHLKKRARVGSRTLIWQITKGGAGYMTDRAAGVFVTVDIVIPRLSPVGTGWEVVFIQRKKQPYQGLWALPGGHLTTDDTSLEAAVQREAQEE